MGRIERLASVTVAVIEHGPIPGSMISIMLDRLRIVYERAEPGEKPDYVELHLYQSPLQLAETLRGEALRVGARVSALYPTAYEAWTGIPRIHVVPGELAGLEYGAALLAHEAVHSVLHPGPGYYMVVLPRRLPAAQGILVAHVAATTVKDLEVHLWMAERGLHEDLAAIQRYWLYSQLMEPRCAFLQEAGDTLRAATVWIAAGAEPPLGGECRGALAGPLRLLRRLAEEWPRARPWSRVGEVVESLAGLVENGVIHVPQDYVWEP
ncbi:MAG TPA: hypothetical protein EYP33_01715 [Pyrodictium sp.]|uniref:Uncharacterized protein n=1 Tax=Pyrodictium delaneyi TaxID=1273541 RepID=A0A832ZSZ5_9CREN|nr:hypothetical protein [Pyrodictium sp.]HIQ23634.1 hypothetical protein [Pyrodictium delaneyi]